MSIVGQLEGMHEAGEVTYRILASESNDQVMTLPAGKSTVELSETPTWEARLSPNGEFSLDVPSAVKSLQFNVIASSTKGRSIEGHSLIRVDVATTEESRVQPIVLPPHRTVPIITRGTQETDDPLTLGVMGEGTNTCFTPANGECDVVLPHGGYVVIARTASTASALIAFTVDESKPIDPVELELRASQPFACELRHADGSVDDYEFVWIGPADATGVERPARFPLFFSAGRVEVSELLPGRYAVSFRSPGWKSNESPPLQVVELHEGSVITRPAP